MSETTTTNPVNLHQLGQEIGGSPFIHASGPDGEGVTRIRSDIDQATLDAAVTNHVADPSVVPPPTTVEANNALIRQQVTNHLTDLRAITGSSGTLTGAQLSNAVRVLARGQIRLIRLAVGLLDGTD